MEILNETVYDTGDLLAFIFWVRDKTYEWECARRLADWKRYGRAQGQTYTPPHLPQMPGESLRIGYYSKPKRKDEKDRWSSRIRGRLGIVRPEQLPLVAMQIVALSAADKDERSIPDEVKLCLAKRVARGLFHQYSVDKKIAENIGDSPVIRWDDTPDKKSAKKAKDKARAERLYNAKQNVRWAKGTVAKLEKRLAQARESLNKKLRRLAKLEGRDVMEATRV